MRVAFTGPSGAGKTTLVKFINETYGLPWLNGSSGDLKTVSDTRRLTRDGLVQGRGHLEVIKSGHANPAAAWTNQLCVLTRRNDLVNSNGDYVTDRCPMDNIVYMLTQTSMYRDPKEIETFINMAAKHMMCLTHVIQLKPLGWVEDNGSRIPNIYYQNMIDAVFCRVIEQYYEAKIDWTPKPKLLVLETSNLDKRKELIKNFLGS